MLYTLPDGKTIALERIQSVSTVRDHGRDEGSIDMSRLGFTIHLAKREIVEVTEPYHFADWADVKKHLNRIRDDIIKQWKALDKDDKD